jgi:MFS family permease
MLCCQLSTLLFGLLLAYWINYAFYFHPGNLQWRFPLLFQIVFAVYIIVVTIFLPDTPRWLMFHEPTPDRGLLVLSKLRGRPVGDPDVQREKDDILYAISVESEAEGSWGDLFKDGGYAGHKRFALALGIQFMQQTSGINIVSYYAPTIFQDVLGMTQERALFVGGFLQVWYILASFLTVGVPFPAVVVELR